MELPGTGGQCVRATRMEEGPEGSLDKVKRLRKEPNILLQVLVTTRKLLQMVPYRVKVYDWQEVAMRLQCLMITSRTLGPQAMRWFCRHPTGHYALVHSVDSIKEQNWTGDATEGKFLCMEGGEHTHQVHMGVASKCTRHDPKLRSHDILFWGKLMRGLAIMFGYIPPPTATRASFHF